MGGGPCGTGGPMGTALTMPGGGPCGLGGGGGAGRAPYANGFRPTSPSSLTALNSPRRTTCGAGIGVAAVASGLAATVLDAPTLDPAVRKNWNQITPPSTASS